jgi:hypothetical protein
MLHLRKASAALQSMTGLPDLILLPTNNPARRQKLRNIALENLRSEEPPFRVNRLI